MGLGGGVPSSLGVTNVPHGATAIEGASSKRSHGDSYNPGQTFRGESDTLPDIAKIEKEFGQAQAKIGVPSHDSISSYGGDRGGSYGRMQNIKG